jgi:hypothetical protein
MFDARALEISSGLDKAGKEEKFGSKLRNNLSLSEVGIAESWYEFERETKGFMFKFIPKTSNAVKCDRTQQTWK